MRKKHAVYRVSNIERTGQRDDTVSSFVRHIPNVRHIDVDMLQVCERCKRVQVLFEASADPRKATTYLRNLQRDLTYPTIVLRVIHTAFDRDHSHPVKVTTWVSGQKSPEITMSWSGLDQWLNRARDWHYEIGACE